MTHGMKPYPKYRASGVPWLENVPEHWKRYRLKSLLKEVDKRTSTGSEPLLSMRMQQGLVDHHEYGGKPIPAESLVGYKVVDPGHIVMNRMRAASGLFAIPTVTGLVSPDYAVFKQLTMHSSQYLLRLFKTPAMMDIFRSESKGLGTGEAGFMRLYSDRFGAIEVVLPPYEEQAEIVRYLDHVDHNINRFIRAKKKRIGLLNEQKRIIVRRMITRGIDPSVKLKPSGVEWLGDIPAHWNVKRLKWVARLQRGYDLTAEQRRDGEFPVVSSGGIIGTHCAARSKGPGVVMGRCGSTDSVFYIEKDFWPHNTSLFVTDFHANLSIWCFFLLMTISKADYAYKSAVPAVDRKDLYEICVPEPPAEEQWPVVCEIERYLSEFDKLIKRCELEISLMREYRARLITDVVTGKLDVRATAARLPDIVPEAQPLDEVEDVLQDESTAEESEVAEAA